jgi:tripartite-type tricarboxylate transporter receptor subunit TctC
MAGDGGRSVTRRAFLALGAALAGPLGTLGDAAAQTSSYPSRPVTFVVGFPAGAVSDLTTRFLAERLARRLGQPVVVENRPGVDGAIGATHVARARPDGHTLLYTSNSTHATNPNLYRRLTYDAVADFAPVAGIARQPTVVVVRADSPATSIAELVTLSRSKPGGLAFGQGNTSTLIVGETLRIRSGMVAERVPFRGNPQSLTELVAGRLDFAVADIFTGLEQVRGGALRALAVSSRERSALAPDIPTLVEGGYLDAPIEAWTGVFAPAATPREIVERLSAEFLAILREQETLDFIARTGSEPFPLGPTELGEHVRTEIRRWGEYVAAAGIEKQ